MTAINAVVLAAESHLFTDAGHYEPDTLILRAIGSKVYSLPHIPAVLAFSGPSRSGDALRQRMAQDDEGAFLAFPDAVAQMVSAEKIDGGYTAVLLSPSRGLAIEEGGKITCLRPGSVIKSLPTPMKLGSDRVAARGLAMMIDQRARHKVVSGYCQHTIIRPEVIASRILHHWPDRPVAADCDTIAAKIKDLSVDTINIAPEAITGVASDSGTASEIQSGSVSVSCPNPFGFPVKIVTSIAYSYSGTVGQSQAGIEIIIKRNGTQIYDKTIWLTGSGHKSGNVTPAFLDQTTGTHTYSMKITVHGDPNGSGGVASVSSGRLDCYYTKK